MNGNVKLSVFVVCVSSFALVHFRVCESDVPLCVALIYMSVKVKGGFSLLFWLTMRESEMKTCV